jgi:hypothetical protein
MQMDEGRRRRAPGVTRIRREDAAQQRRLRRVETMTKSGEGK